VKGISFSSLHIMYILPEIILAAFGILIMLLDVILKRKKKIYIFWISLIALALTFFVSIALWSKPGSGMVSTMVNDTISLFFNFIFILGTFLTLLMSLDYIKREDFDLGEYYALLLFSTTGMMIVSSAIDLITLFLGLALLSLSLYILAGINRKDLRSNESAIKYLLVGAFASAFLLYGIALIYGATGFVNLKLIAQYLSNQSQSYSTLLYGGLGLMLAGFGFKIALVPFHGWQPDVYEGAPTSITAFMSAGVKAAGFAALIRLLLVGLPQLKVSWVTTLQIIAIITMSLGNIVAIAQSNIKRMLAYSSIAHAGYMLIGIISANELGIASLLFYLIIYSLMNLGAFAVVILVGRKGDKSLSINNYAGLSSKHPLLALIMSIFLLSLAGIPPMGGFVAKFYIFSAAVKAGFIPLAIIAVINSVISLVYYLRVIVAMYSQKPEKKYSPVVYSPSIIACLIISLVGILYLGLFPSGLMHYASMAVSALFGG
jgi:NADH-quinone oxidoreductase subunit N